jgi:predicted MFS family arabinose efflux permease
LVGPAVAGIVIAKASIGICFWANSISFAAVIIALVLMRENEFHASGATPVTGRGQIRAGLRYATQEPNVLFPLILVAVIGTLGFNFQIVLPMLADVTFHGNEQTYGAMSSVIAIGSVCGAMFSATRRRPSKRLLIGAAIALGVTEIALGFAPNLTAAYLTLPAIGLATMLFIPTANSTLQLSSIPEMRGRVLGLFSLLFLGSTPIGGPLVGWISQAWTPRAALFVGGAASIAVGLVVGAIMLSRQRAERALVEAELAQIPAAAIAEPAVAGETT